MPVRFRARTIQMNATNRRIAFGVATCLLTASFVYPPISARVTPGTEPDLPELNSLQHVDRRVSINFENVRGGLHVYSEGPEDCCHVTVSLNHVAVRRALEVVSADRLRVTLPELLTKIDPGYPSDARDARVDGKVVLQAVLRENGTVGEVQVLTAIPGWPSLDRNAVEALRERKYRPAMKDGHPVSVYFTVMIQFRLAEASPGSYPQ